MSNKMEQQHYALRHIFLKIDKLRSKIEKIKSRMDKGEDIEKLAQIEDGLAKVQVLAATITGDVDNNPEN